VAASERRVSSTSGGVVAGKSGLRRVAGTMCGSRLKVGVSEGGSPGGKKRGGNVASRGGGLPEPGSCRVSFGVSRLRAVGVGDTGGKKKDGVESPPGGVAKVVVAV